MPLLSTSQHQIAAVFGGSFLDFDWSDGDVVFANSTCFDEALMSDMAAVSYYYYASSHDLCAIDGSASESRGHLRDLYQGTQLPPLRGAGPTQIQNELGTCHCVHSPPIKR